MTDAKEMFDKIGRPSYFYKDKLVRLFNIEDIAAIIQKTVSDYERDVLPEKLLQSANNASNRTLEHFEKEVLPGKIAEARNAALDNALNVRPKLSPRSDIKPIDLWESNIKILKSTPPSQTNSWLRQVFIEANASNESKPNPKMSNPLKTPGQDLSPIQFVEYIRKLDPIAKAEAIAERDVQFEERGTQSAWNEAIALLRKDGFNQAYMLLEQARAAALKKEEVVK